MSATITRTVPINEVPQTWREGLDSAIMVTVTIEADISAQDLTIAQQKQQRALVVKEVAGIWADRGEEIETLQQQIREANYQRFNTLIPE